MMDVDRRSLLAGAGILGFAQAAGAQSPGRLVVATQGSPRSLEPVREFSNVAWRIGFNMFESLIRIDYRNGMTLAPGLAQSWTRVSPSVVELTLKEGVRFHDGSLMTAEDVVFSFGAARMTGENAPGRAVSRIFLGALARVDAVDARTVRVSAQSSDPLIEQRLAGWTSQIISKRAYEAAPSFEAWERAPVGTGPYKAREFRIDQRCVLEAHDAYHGGRPPAREIVFQVMPELATRVAALASGDVDIITELSPDQAPLVERSPGARVVGGAILNLRVVVYDKTNPVLADPRVRRALSLAIDRDAIVATLYRGRTRATATFQHPAMGAMNGRPRRGPAYDPDLARRLLREADYAGQPIPYRTHQGYYTLQAQTAQALSEMWRAVGLTIGMEFKENWTQILDASSPRGIRDWSNTLLFGGDPVGGLWRLYGVRGPIQGTTREWTNAEFNAAGTVLESSTDPAARLSAHERMLDIWDEVDPPGAALHDLVMLYGVRNSVNWTPYQVEYMDFGPGNLSLGGA